MINVNLKKKNLQKKRTFAKNAWNVCYNWLINYIPECIDETVRGVKGKV